MPPRSLPLLPRISLILALGIAIGGCRPGTPGKPTAWEKSRETLVAELLIPSFDGSLAKLDSLSRAAGAPFSGADLRTMLMTQANAPSEVLDLVDLSRPVSAVLVVPTAHSEWFPAVALSTKPGAAPRFVAAMGQEVGRSGAVIELKQPEGRPLFARVTGDTVVMGPSAAALTAAADIAVGARRTIPEDVLLTIYPEAMARAVGRTQADAVADLRKQALDEHARLYRADDRSPPAAETATLGALLDAVMGPLADAAAAEQSLTIDPATGISIGTRCRPRQGTALARRLAVAAPLAFDTRVVGDGPVAAASGAGPGGLVFPLLGQILAAQGQAGVRGATEASALFARVLAQLDGSHSAALRFPQGGASFDLALGLRKTASAANALDALAALASSPALGNVLTAVYGSRAPTLSARREGDRLRIDVALPTSTGAGPIALLRAITGKPSLSIVAAVSPDGRLLLSSHPNPSRLAQMAAASRPATPSGDLGTALASAPGKESFAYVDLWAFARPLIETFAGGGQAQAFSFISMLPGVSSLSLPLFGQQTSGADLQGHFHLPLSTLKSIANVSRLVGGMGR